MIKRFDEDVILKEWAPLIEQMVGSENKDRVRWMSLYAHTHAMHDRARSGNALNETYNTLSMLPGMGNVTAAADPTSYSAFATGATGSGDKFPSLLPLSLQVAARTVGFDVVSVVPMQGPVGVLTYIDYVYGGGDVDTADKPILIKVSSPKSSGSYTVGTTYWFVDDAPDTDTYDSGDQALKVVYVGQSRIDNKEIWRVIGTYAFTSSWAADATLTVADVISGADCVVVSDDSGSPLATTASILSAAVTDTPVLVKALEDHIAGVTGAGATDAGNWNGDGYDETATYEGMSRDTGEHTYYRQMTIQVYTKFIAATTDQIAASITNEQIQDLKAQFGLDVKSMVENILANELSQSINKNILNRLYRLGWEHNYAYEARWGITLNFRADGNTSATTKAALGRTASRTIDVLGFQTYGSTANYENLHTIQRRVFSKILAASNIIQHNGRHGEATFVVTNLQIATALQDCAGFTFAPAPNNLQNSKSLYPQGTIYNRITVYVDPNLRPDECFVLVGRKGADEEPGVKFMPYLMAESYETISEGTMSPKIAVKSRYSITDAGHHPETQYYMFFVYTGTTTLF